MHITYLNYYYDAEFTSVDELLRKYHSSVEWCRAVRRAGAERVSVVQRFRMPSVEHVDGVEYHFVADDLPAKLRPWHFPTLAHRSVASLVPTLVHLNGSMLSFKRLREILNDGTATVWQHHGGGPPNFPKRLVWRHGFRDVDGFLFTSAEQAQPWCRARLIGREQPVYEITEASSTFELADLVQKKRELNIHGNEVFLWVGRLNHNKDPRTVLRGFAYIVPRCMNPLLMMVYNNDELLTDLRSEVTRLGIERHVRFVGAVPYDRLPSYYSAADYFVLGSHDEGSGFALLEALASGVTPIVTDIPSFRAITSNGTVGALWKPGDPDSFVQAFHKAKQNHSSRQALRAYFERDLSYDVLGKKALRLYEEIIRRKNGGGR